MSVEWIYGIHAVQAVLASSPSRVLGLRVAKGREERRLQKILSLAEREGLAIERVDKKKLDKQFAELNHQGVAAQCKAGEVYTEQWFLHMLDGLEEAPFILILDGVTDPHNLGACLRSAEAAGVHAVIAPRDRSVTLTATVRKVACGAAEVLPYIQVTNLSRTMGEMAQRGIWITGTAGEAQQMAYDVDYNGPCAIVMGAEGDGMRRLTKECCDNLVKLPMAGTVSSLNVSVATGIMLFEAVRQRV